MKNTINLLSFGEKPLSFWEKFYVWALTIGRYLIIVTELIILVAFLYKFKVDNDISNVQSDLRGNALLAKQNYSQEQAIATYQHQIKAQQLIFADQQKASSTLAHTLGLVTSGITITNFTFDNGVSLSLSGSITGTGNSQLSQIQALANTFKSDRLYNNVTLASVVTNDETKVTTFTLDTTLSK